MDHKSWMNLVRSEFVVNSDKLLASGIDLQHEIENRHPLHSAMKPNIKMTARIKLMGLSGHSVEIKGDAELVHAILEKLNAV